MNPLNKISEAATVSTPAYFWCGGHSVSINTCGVWGVRIEIQVSRREFHTYIHLD